MKTRKETADFINSDKFTGKRLVDCGRVHIGLIEIKRLMDFIYEGKPEENEVINSERW